jgi:hypothetical protein
MPMVDLSDRLLPGERILWSGQPAQGLLLTGQDAFVIPFSLFWCGAISIPVVGLLSHPEKADIGGLFLVPFVLIGLYMLVGRFLIDAWIRRGVQYAVTDKRILIWRPGPFSKFTSLNLDRLPGLSISERASGRGTIRFGEPMTMQWGMRWGRNYNNNLGSAMPSLDPTPQFLAIENARSVFDRIQQVTPGGG